MTAQASLPGCRMVARARRASGAWAQSRRADEIREDHEPLRGAERRVARGQHQPVGATLGDPDGVRIDDALLPHPVGEAAVRHLEQDAIAATQVVEIAEGGAVRRAVPGDGHGAALAGSPDPG